LTAQWFKQCNATELKAGRSWDPNIENTYIEYTARQRNVSRCERNWDALLEQTLGCFYWHGFIWGKFRGQASAFDFVHDIVGLPRVLVLGDSISGGTFATMIRMNLTVGVNMHFAPANCGGFGNYFDHLDTWLGLCSWDIIQFNVGAHFHVGQGKSNQTFVPSDAMYSAYEAGLLDVTTRLQQHSPNTDIIFAFTTPSPFDSLETMPSEKSCVKYKKFQPAGYVSFLNYVANKTLGKLNVSMIDRYSAVYPALNKNQIACDIHFKENGYKLLAEADWKVVRSKLLSRSLGGLSNFRENAN
jgi:hypothetical protein